MQKLFAPEAYEEVARAQEEIQERALFLADLRTTLTKVLEYPLRRPFHYKDARRWSLRRFPYGLVYRVLSQGGVRIIAFMHLHDRPFYWKDRR